MSYLRYISCSNCGRKFSAAWSQDYPGGTDAPGCVFLQGLAALLVGLLCLVLAWWFVSARVILGVMGISFVGGAVAAFFGMSEAYTLCRKWEGGKCPHCGTQNQVTTWSL